MGAPLVAPVPANESDESTAWDYPGWEAEAREDTADDTEGPALVADRAEMGPSPLQEWADIYGFRREEHPEQYDRPAPIRRDPWD